MFVSSDLLFTHAVDDHEKTRKHTSVSYCGVYAHLQKYVVSSFNGTLRIKSENNLTKIMWNTRKELTINSKKTLLLSKMDHLNCEMHIGHKIWIGETKPIGIV